ncbi:adenosylmethionine decarboxylase [Bradyrhizobium neotropicale]|uniref:adenosylmethionine decarboxylase n=1 Tax=Bradyrhizobium neotropicale TaxID=1497615 RepID=UPI0009ED591F|nr:adenosylmethionine decarboxylase [Bradyrhizobium neotropicale]
MTDDGAIDAGPVKSIGGPHILLDLWEANHLYDPSIAEDAIRKAVRAAKATLIHLHVHRFFPSHGVSAVALLAESHMTLHTWPESGYVAADVFVCGSGDVKSAVAVLIEAFQPKRSDVRSVRRGNGQAGRAYDQSP